MMRITRGREMGIVSDVELVMMCRDRLIDMRRRTEEIELLKRSREQLPEASAYLDETIREAEGTLRSMRREFPVLVGRAMDALKRLPRQERRVMMLYYVVGLSLKEITNEVHYSVRHVQKMKKAGLDMLR